ncbi:RNA methyltransferase [Candidatus Saccharibacteria bacterium]|nr:RNA methyltransferase [Candidatus Saccharibacteria bacterium]MBH1972761.1 RNA methyltransferase [Candidatus Saccharibacteria bacterium]MBH1990963.1 RNA methyltransferase [Candidatus Saccharibacteria bacterium]
MKAITSSHNDIYKNLKQLASGAKYRRRDSQTLLEGIHLCESYLQHVGQPLMYAYSHSAPENPEVAALMDTCDELSTPSILLSDSHFKALSTVDNGIGILFVVSIPSLEQSKIVQKSALLLEDIQDPGNMGAILRTAAAAGITEIYTSNGSTSAWSPKTLRAGMGAHFALTIYENCDLAELITTAEVQILATSLGATKSIYEKDLSQPTAWLLGNEGQGVSDTLLALQVEKVIIPQNPGVESLNVAAATAVCLFEQMRQLHHNA